MVNTQGNSKMVKEKEKEIIIIVKNMKENGKMIKKKEKLYIIINMVINMKEIL